ncbi:sugar phosphate isomerase/epimerase [Bacillus subtilis]|uniref:sugar phosphate isomerase/epimerase family protein n=1 Tax=Bacillus inaquosorum TaxID=483913 RepID=UPI0010622658|nr:sugar phosphate isomerase/epimerase [Bacillus inaquosorum]TDO13258.1 sugar phosphate isomerase/epimerase [Bacillus subtilis]TYS24240.1 sugar phosphate isomerase/epimerase [Bacillus subtilis]WIW28637.1 sugar phosphate isomerase/epimerase [Bacillus inaquosorum]
MRMSLVTDCLDFMSLEEVANTAVSLGYDTLEFACGNWSKAPHLDLDSLLESSIKRDKFVSALKERNLSIEALNCSGNQLAPNKEGREHQIVVEKTFRLAELLGVKTINMMSGLPGGGPGETTANWITTSWPPVNVEILNWQWNEVALPYWEDTVKRAKEHGIARIALENHGSQLVYNPETLFKLRNHVGDMIGMNFDPSHLLWMGGDPIKALRTLGPAIYHVHAKDTRIERGLVDIDGVLDTKTIDNFVNRSWNYVALGHGHDVSWWKEFFSVLSMVGYDGTVSLEMEDLTMDPLVALKKSTSVLKEALPKDFD